MTPTPAVGGYVGKRRAAVPVDGSSSPTPTPTTYVGKRRVTTPVDDFHDGSLARPLSPRIVIQEQPVGIRLDDALGDELDEDARVTTAEIRAIMDAALDDTAPRPRIRLDEAPPAITVPLQRHGEPVKTLPVQPPVKDQTYAGEQLFREPSTESIVDLPRISVAATYAADLSDDATALLPAVSDIGRRRARTSRGVARHRRPSMPIIAGVAATLAAIGGAVFTTQPHLTPSDDTRLSGASALTGTTGSGAVGHTGTVTGSARGPAVSRDDQRTEQSAADDAADARARALGNLDAEAEGQQKYLTSNRWVLPVDAGVYHLTGRFGDVSGLWASVHTGLDFAAPEGTPIHAIARGVVSETGWGGAYGNRTIVTLPDGTEIWYCHQSRFGTSVGDTVAAGQVIGYVGATGNVTGPHVHIEVRPGGGDPVDPDAAFKAHGVDPDANQ